MSSKRAERALRQIVREVRAEGTPEVDWSSLEASLPSGPVPHVANHHVRSRLLLAAAALAVVAGAFAWSRDAESPEALAVQERAQVTHESNGDLLAPGTAITTLGERRTIEHPHRATWTLAPASRATLVTSGNVVVVRLEQGSLTAHIVPSTRPETFAVEAADVRVAAHGTVFSVTLDERAVAVAVEEGRVLVGPRSTPGVGKLLASPTTERFTLLGAPTAEERRERASRPAQRAPHPSAESAPVAPSATSAAEPSAETIGEATARVIELASACFSERTSASDGVRVTAHTALTFRAAPDGAIASIQFEPPLAPNVQACIDASSAKLRVTASPDGFRGSRVVDLER